MTDTTTLERTELVIRGVRSELTLEHGAVAITKEATTQPDPTRVRFGVDLVRGTSLQVPPRGGRGWLHVAVVGGSPPPPTELAAASDPYTLPIGSRSVGRARRLAKLVDDHVRTRGLPSEALGDGTTSTAGVSVLPAGQPLPDDLGTATRRIDGGMDHARIRGLLDELLEVGVITGPEYDRALDRMASGVV